MLYESTRGQAEKQSFTQVLVSGQMSDGGLAWPEKWPQVNTARLRSMSYQELALEIMTPFATDIQVVDVRNIINKSYTASFFGSSEITPLKMLEPGLALLELSKGKTWSFKDVALQFVGNAMEYVLEKNNDHVNIVTATSGDTGSAAAYAVRGKKRQRLFVLYPRGRTSECQRRQMTTLKERNIFALEVDAPFDDLQTMAKALFNDHDFKAKYKLGSMNSINWARILAQAVYYGYASLQMTGRGKSKLVDFSVPTGNVGNVLSAFVAKKMGFPIDQIIVATNENDVMHQSLLTGVYRLRTSADIVQTTSPSMDIAIASNYERLFFEASGRRPKLIRTLWAELAKEGSFYAPATARKLRADGWRSGRTNMMEVEGTIRDIYEKYEKVIDPHTAVGVHVGLQFRKSEVPLVVVETAQAAKFEDTIRRAIGIDPPKPKGYKELMSASEYHIPLHADVKALKQFIIDHV